MGQKGRSMLVPSLQKVDITRTRTRNNYKTKKTSTDIFFSFFLKDRTYMVCIDQEHYTMLVPNLQKFKRRVTDLQ